MGCNPMASRPILEWWILLLLTSISFAFSIIPLISCQFVLLDFDDSHTGDLQFGIFKGKEPDRSCESWKEYNVTGDFANHIASQVMGSMASLFLGLALLGIPLVLILPLWAARGIWQLIRCYYVIALISVSATFSYVSSTKDLGCFQGGNDQIFSCQFGIAAILGFVNVAILVILIIMSCWWVPKPESSLVYAKNDRAVNNCGEDIPQKKVGNFEPEYQINPGETGQNFVTERTQEANRYEVVYPLHHDEETTGSQTSSTDPQGAVVHTRSMIAGAGLNQQSNDMDVESAQNLSPASSISIPTSCEASLSLLNDGGSETAARANHDPLSATSPNMNPICSDSIPPSPVKNNNLDSIYENEPDIDVRQSIPLQDDPPGEENHTKSVIISIMRNKDS